MTHFDAHGQAHMVDVSAKDETHRVARAAGVSVRTYAMSQQDGGMGDLVMVQSLASKERYAARVIGVRELEIFTAGASAAELAANQAPAQ